MEIIQDSNVKSLDGLVDALLNSKTIGVFIYQDDCRIVCSNKTFREFIGYSEEELYLLTPYDIIADEYKPAVKKLAERRIKGEVFAAEQITHMHITKEGVFKPTVIFVFFIFKLYTFPFRYFRLGSFEKNVIVSNFGRVDTKGCGLSRKDYHI